MPKPKGFDTGDNEPYTDISDSGYGEEDRHFTQKDHNDWDKSMSKEEYDGIFDYTNKKYMPINQYLREDKMGSGEDKELEATIKNIENGLSKYQFKENMMLYRKSTADLLGALGISYDGDNENFINIVKGHIGSIVKDKGFTSTSTRRGTWSGKIQYEIKAPKGTNGAYTEKISRKEEYEVTLNRGTRFKIIGAHIDGRGMPTVTLQIVK